MLLKTGVFSTLSFATVAVFTIPVKLAFNFIGFLWNLV